MRREGCGTEHRPDHPARSGTFGDQDGPEPASPHHGTAHAGRLRDRPRHPPGAVRACLAGEIGANLSRDIGRHGPARVLRPLRTGPVWCRPGFRGARQGLPEGWPARDVFHVDTIMTGWKGVRMGGRGSGTGIVAMARRTIPPAAPARRAPHSGMRRRHERLLLLSPFRLHRSLSTAEIARLTGLSARTVPVIVRQREADGLLRRLAPRRGKVGQFRLPVAGGPAGAFAISLDVGDRTGDVIRPGLSAEIARLSDWPAKACHEATAGCAGLRLSGNGRHHPWCHARGCDGGARRAVAASRAIHGIDRHGLPPAGIHAASIRMRFPAAGVASRPPFASFIIARHVLARETCHAQGY